MYFFALSFALTAFAAPRSNQSKDGQGIVSPFPPSQLPPCAPKACAILTNFQVPGSDNIILCPTNQNTKTPAETFQLFKYGKTKDLTFIKVMVKINVTGAWGVVGDLSFPISYVDDKCLAGYRGIIPSDLNGPNRNVGMAIAG